MYFVIGIIAISILSESKNSFTKGDLGISIPKSKNSFTTRSKKYISNICLVRWICICITYVKPCLRGVNVQLSTVPSSAIPVK